MDDLLSVALSEAGLDELDEFFLPNSDADVAPSGGDAEVKEEAPVKNEAERDDFHNDHGQYTGPRPSGSDQFKEEEHPSPVSTPEPKYIVDNSTGSTEVSPNGSIVQRHDQQPIMITASMQPKRVLVKRTVTTPHGNIVRTSHAIQIINEKGEKILKPIRGPPPSSGATRVIVRRGSGEQPRRIIVVRQGATPTTRGAATPQRQIGTTENVISTYGSPSGLVRRVVTRGGQPVTRGATRTVYRTGNGTTATMRDSPMYRADSRTASPLHDEHGGLIRRYGSAPYAGARVVRGPAPTASYRMTPSTPTGQYLRSALANNSYTTYRPIVRGGPNGRVFRQQRVVGAPPPSTARPQNSPLAYSSMPTNIVKDAMPGTSRAQGGSGQMQLHSPGVSSKAQPLKPERRTAKEEMKAAIQAASIRQARNEIDEEEENLGHAETYADYRPAKLRSGMAHPDSVVETASLSSVQPPDIRYHVTIPEYLIDTGAISALQLEAVIYACQMHEKFMPNGERVGYLIGDGAGVGKGRTVACIIFENYLLDRKRALWLSVSNDLKFDAERDLRDIGAGNIQVHLLNKMKYSKISGKENGFVKKGVMFGTYSSLIGECRTAKRKYQSRMKQLIQWLGIDFDGVIILDECHRAKNLVPTTGAKPTKTGQMVLELQKALPKARVVYASATGATEPRNMAYMTRLGLWGPGQAFADFSDFINAVERRGVGAMEIVAMDMKQRGLYLARQLSFRGVNFTIREVQLSDDFVKTYDDSVRLWMEVRRQFQAALAQLDEEERLTCKHIWGQFWASHQRFFKYLCIAAKVEACVQIVREAISSNKCVVIGLQSTGESRTLDALDDMGGELTEFVSTAKAVLQSLVDKHFPSGGDVGTDIFRDFDRMFNEFDRPKKKRAPRSDGMDVLEELGLGTSMYAVREPRVKRPRRENDSDANSTTSSSGDESDPGSEREGDSETEEDASDDELKLEDEQDWLKALLAEAASSSEESDNGEEEEEKREPTGNGMTMGSPSQDEEFNPFSCDFSTDDPWASKQQVVEDSPKKKKEKKTISEEEILEEKRRRRMKRRKKRRALKKEQRRMEKKKNAMRQIDSEAVKATAADFMSSSKLIDEAPDTYNPQMVKAELLAAIERLGPSLPANTLDQLIDELGGPEFVAEMTGRKGRIVSRENGDVEYELRHEGTDVPLELMNMDEKDKFMKGEKYIAIISEAASSGISLQSDRRAPNKRRRVHITLELPWSADKAIQQFGRTHRSNQVSAPEYIFLISELAGEKRFASVVAKRLESLGALTHGDRRATESRDLSQFNFDTKYGRSALEVLLKSITGQMSPPLIPPPEKYKPGDFFKDIRVYLEGVGVLSCGSSQPSDPSAVFTIEREASTIAKFLNRILGLPVHAQNALFSYFSDILAELIAQAKHDGTYDMGIMDLGTGGDQVRKLETRVFLGRVDKGSFRVEIHKIGVERGVSWEDAYAIFQEHNTGEDGFYVSNLGTRGKKVAALVYGIGKRRLDSGARLYAVTRPSTGRSPKLETFAELSKKFEKAEPEVAKPIWEEQFEGSSKHCQHAYVLGKCKNEASGVYCEVGRRQRTYFVLSGSVLSVWPVVEEVLSSGGRDRRASRMQVIRVRTEQDQKIVGLLVLPQFVRSLITQLEEHCGRCYVEQRKGDKAALAPADSDEKTDTSMGAPPAPAST